MRAASRADRSWESVDGGGLHMKGSRFITQWKWEPDASPFKGLNLVFFNLDPIFPCCSVSVTNRDDCSWSGSSDEGVRGAIARRHRTVCSLRQC